MRTRPVDVGAFRVDAAVTTLLADSRLQLKSADVVAAPQSVSQGAPSDFPVLSSGHIHEWHLTDSLNQRNLWFPPLTLLTLLACSRTHERIIWIGRRCWPTFQLLCAHFPCEAVRKILKRSTFLDPLTDAERFWAISEGLRCSGVGCVVADGSGMNSTVNRRAQLAAESGRGIGLIARPPWELAEPFAAGTRWSVQAIHSDNGQPQWEIELKRCRGQRQDAPSRWIVGWNYRVYVGTGSLHFSADVGRGSHSEKAADRVRTA